MNSLRDVVARVAALHARTEGGVWNAADDLLDAVRVLFPPYSDEPAAESIQILAAIGRLLQHAPIATVPLYTARAEDVVPASLRPRAATGPPEQDVLLLSLAAAALSEAEPWPAGPVDPDSLRRAVTAFTGPVVCRVLTLRVCAMLYLLRRYPEAKPELRAILLRRLVWLTDPRTEDPGDILAGLTGERDPLAPPPRAARSRSSVEALPLFPLADWAHVDVRGVHLRLGGRVVNVRKHRTVSFADLAWNGREIQLCLEAELGVQLRPGDLVVVIGRTGATRSGHAALFVDEVEHRHPGALPGRPDTLQQTAILTPIRRYLQDASFAEAATPVLADTYRGGASRPFSTWAYATDRSQYLRVTTEPALLELIACGITRCYEIGPSFRNERLRGQKIKEFTMLEAYSVDLDRSGMLGHICGLIEAACSTVPALRCFSFDEAFEQTSGVNPSDNSAVRALADDRIPGFASRTGNPDLLVRRLWRNEFRSRLTGLVAITDIPGPSSPLIEGEGRAAQRTWLYLEGVEIAEISRNERRPQVLATAFARQFSADRHPVHRDYQDIVATFEAGLPPVVGVGLGLTRLAHVLHQRAAPPGNDL